MAERGVSKLGIRSAANKRLTSSRSARPTRTPRKCDWRFWATETRARATSIPLATATGQLSTTVASTPGSALITRSAFSYRLASASPIRSIGFPRDQFGGSTCPAVPGLWRQRSKPSALRDQSVRCQYTNAAAVGDNGQPVTGNSAPARWSQPRRRVRQCHRPAGFRRARRPHRRLRPCWPSRRYGTRPPVRPQPTGPP